MLDNDKTFFPIDPSATRLSLPESAIRWIDPLSSDEVSIVGSDVPKKEKAYTRLSEGEVKTMAEYHSDDTYICRWTAGLGLRFSTNAKTLLLDVTLEGPSSMCHMPASGQCGFDCYVYDEKKKRYVFHNTGIYDPKETHYRVELFLFPWNEEKTRRVWINFPLYQGVKALQVGVEKEAFVEPDPFEKKERILMCGTSILEGGVVSRPGMLYTNILSRYLDREILNYGFSGAALLEPKLGTILAKQKDVGLLVVDAEANAGCESWMRDNFYPFMDNYYSLCPDVPVVVVSRIPFAMDYFDPRREEIGKYYLRFQKKLVKHYEGKGKKIFFLDGRKFFPSNADEFTVDGIHPTDLGHYLLAEAQYPLLKSLTRKEK